MTDTAGTVTQQDPRPHGTVRRYHAGPGADGNPGRCLCPPCRAANAEWQRNRVRQVAYGRWDPFADAGPVREHVQALQATGAGHRSIAAAAGVPVNTVHNLLWGKPPKPPARRVRHDTAARLLAVRPGPAILDPRAAVDATGTRRRLQALAAAGHAFTVLAGRLGMSGQNTRRLTRLRRVTARSACAVAALYDELWDAPPDESTPHAAGRAARARREAAAEGWPPPAAWDDDAIDDPAAPVPDGWRRGIQGTSAGLAEDALELMARGMDRNQVAERLKVKRDTLDAALARTARRTAQETTRTDPAEERSHAAA